MWHWVVVMLRKLSNGQKEITAVECGRSFGTIYEAHEDLQKIVLENPESIPEFDPQDVADYQVVWRNEGGQ